MTEQNPSVSSGEVQPLDYSNPVDALPPAKMRLHPRVWFATMLYTMSLFTPATVPADSPRMMHAKIYMGWQLVVSSLEGVAAGLASGHLMFVLLGLAPPLVNVLFMTAVIFEFAAIGSPSGVKAAQLRRSAGIMSLVCVPLAILSVGLLFLGVK